MKKRTYFIALLIFLLAGSSFAQKGNLSLTFSGEDAISGNSIDLQSVHIENLSQSCDTTVYGAEPSLFLEWLGINDEFSLSGFSISNCYPNPFNGTTQFTVTTNDKQSINIGLVNIQGVSVAHFERQLSKGTHTFEISESGAGFYFLNISNGNFSKSQKLLCQNQERNMPVQINYRGTANNNLKSVEEITGFGFQPGDQLKMTATASNYEDEIIFDSPTVSSSYAFELVAETGPTATVTFNVNMAYQVQLGYFDPSNSNLDIAGSMNNWEGTPMYDTDNDLIFSVDIPNIEIESTIEFKCRRNGVWDGTEEFANGGANRSYTVQETGNNLEFWYTDEEPPAWVCGDPFTDDRDGQAYNTVEIGTQCWMAENLNYTTSSGSALYDYNSAYVEYGRLYIWDAAMEACPDGWHLPLDSEWTTIVNHLGGESVAGGKMKETGTAHWNSPNVGATNESGFTGFAGGKYLGIFNLMGIYGFFWSATEVSGNAWDRYLNYQTSTVVRSEESKWTKYSVRCLKD